MFFRQIRPADKKRMEQKRNVRRMRFSALFYARSGGGCPCRRGGSYSGGPGSRRRSAARGNAAEAAAGTTGTPRRRPSARWMWACARGSSRSCLDGGSDGGRSSKPIARPSSTPPERPWSRLGPREAGPRGLRPPPPAPRPRHKRRRSLARTDLSTAPPFSGEASRSSSRGFSRIPPRGFPPPKWIPPAAFPRAGPSPNSRADGETNLPIGSAVSSVVLSPRLRASA